MIQLYIYPIRLEAAGFEPFSLLWYSGRDQSGSIKLYCAAALFGDPERITTRDSGRGAEDQTFLQSNAKQSKDNHNISIIIQVSNSDLHSLTTDFVRHLGVQNLCLLPLKSTRTTVGTITKQVKAYEKKKDTILLQAEQHRQRHNRLVLLQCPWERHTSP